MSEVYEFSVDQTIAVLKASLDKLLQAEVALKIATIPYTPMPRFKVIYWCYPTIYWPLFRNSTNHTDVIDFHFRWGDNSNRYKEESERANTASSLMSHCKNQPRRIMQVLNGIKISTQWCLDRAEGRKKAALEILRQQDKYSKQLSEEAVLLALGQLPK